MKKNFIVTYGRYVIVLGLLALICCALLYLTYENVKKDLIENLNERQMIHAKQATKGIKNFFHEHISILKNMAKNKHVAALDENGKRMMREYYSSHSDEISIIARIDGRGRITHSEPYNPKVIRQTVTEADAFQEVKRTHQSVVSDVFINRRGFKTIIVHVPVFNHGSFDGALSILLPFDFIARHYVEDIKIGQNGYAWIISRKGIELSCPVPGHVGNSVFDNCRDFPDILAMAEKMKRGEQGVTTYHFNQIGGNGVGRIVKHAVYMPIHLGNNFWSIAVATPEDELLGTMTGFRNRIILIGILLLIGMGVFYYLLFRTRILVEEVERRRKAEDALRQSESAMRSVLLAAPVGICIMKDRLYQSANVFWSKNFGYSEESIIGKDTRMLYENDEEYDRVGRELYKHLTERGLASIETRLRRSDGVFRDVILTAAPLQTDDLTAGTVVIIQDITERKQAEKALRESEENYRNLFENANEAIFVAENGKTVFLNPIATVISGHSFEELTEKPFIEFIHPDDRDKVLDRHIRRMKGEVLPHIYSFRVIHKNGNIRWVELNAVLINWKGKKATLNFLSDITDRKRAEEALNESERRYRELSIIDDLTQLYNSRYFYQQLKMELDRADRYNQPLTLLLLDIDDFKQFNDTYGHIEGDQVLLRFGHVVKRCLR